MNTEQMTNERLLVTLEMSGWIERSTIAKTIELLIEVERRKLDLELSYSSMFDFCLRRLRFSENEAFRRLVCARLVARFPSILEPLRDGAVTLTNIVLLRDIFTEENVDALLAEIANKTRKEVEAIVARLRPKPDVPASIRPIVVQPALIAPAADETPPPTPKPHQPPPKAATRPLSEDRYAVSFTAPGSLLEKIDKVGTLMHRPKSNDLAELFGLALDALIAKLEKEKLGKTASPRKAKPSKDPGYVTAAARREVTTRDEMQCTFVSVEGERCPARERLELDHRQPRARGGTGEASNLRLLCARHNLYEAEKAFGRDHIERSIHTAQAKRRSNRTASAPIAPGSDNVEPPASCYTHCAQQPKTGPTPVPAPAVDGESPGASAAAEPRDSEDHERKRASLRYALVQDQGFKSGDVDRVIAAMVTDHAAWSRPLAVLFVEALRKLMAANAGGRSSHRSS